MHRLMLVVAFFYLPVALAGEDPFDFDVVEDAGSAETAVPVLEIQLRHDAVRDLPRPVEPDFDRQELRLHAGFDWQLSDELLLKATSRMHATSDNERDFAFNLDNEKIEEVAIDEFYVDQQWQVVGFRLGQSMLPVTLSPMLWDPDLRIRGLALNARSGDGISGMRWFAAGGSIDHPAGSFADFDLLQWQADWQPRGLLRATLGIMRFTDLDKLAKARRTNLVTPDGRLAERFEPVFLAARYHFTGGMQGWQAALQLVSNSTASDANEAGRLEILHDPGIRGGLEFGLASQRIQRNAVPAAVNDDDWWFPTNMRGHRVWLGYRGQSGWGVRMSVFQERLDPLPEPMRRLLVDISYRH